LIAHSAEAFLRQQTKIIKNLDDKVQDKNLKL